MLLQTNSYIVPREKRAEHARLLRKFRQALMRLGCDHFEVYEQTGPNWSSADNSGRFVQIMRFRDRKHQLAVQNAERGDATAQALLKEFCELINLPYQQQQGLFAVGFYQGFIRTPEIRHDAAPEPAWQGEQPDSSEEQAEEPRPAEQAEMGESAVAAEHPEVAETPEPPQENLMAREADTRPESGEEESAEHSHSASEHEPVHEDLLEDERPVEAEEALPGASSDPEHEEPRTAESEQEREATEAASAENGEPDFRPDLSGEADTGDFDDDGPMPADEHDRAHKPTYPFNS